MDRDALLIKIKEICKAEESDLNLEYALDSAISIAKNYCGIKELPEELENTVIDMAIDIFKSGQYGQEDESGILNSITEGDISMSFGDALFEQYGLSSIKNYEKRMMPFRRIKWS